MISIRTLVFITAGLMFGTLLRECHAATFGVHLFSYHDHAGYESFTPGVYVRMDSGLTAGVLSNSVKKTSAYAGWTWEYGPAAVTAGVISGYGKPTLLLSPSVLAGPLRIAIIPRVGHHDAAIHFALERSF